MDGISIVNVQIFVCEDTDELNADIEEFARELAEGGTVVYGASVQQVKYATDIEGELVQVEAVVAYHVGIPE